MSQYDAMAKRESQKFKTVLSSIGTVILKVCEGPESVTEMWNGFHRSATLSGHSQTSRIPVPIEFSTVLPSCESQKPMHLSATLSGDQQTSRNYVSIQFLPCFCLLGPFQNHSIGL